MTSKEIWRVVPSVAGLIASSHGRLMVLPYVAQMPHGGVRHYGGEPVIGQWDGGRYLYVLKAKTYKVHRLICEAFNGPPGPNQVCMHLDENSANNRPENLAWGTQKENLNAQGFIRYCRQRTGASSPIVKGKAKKAATQ